MPALVFGASAGSGLAGLLLSSNIEGSSRQLNLVKALGDFLSSAVLVLLLILEYSSELNLLSNLLRFTGDTIQEQAAWAFLLTKIAPGIIMLSLSSPLWNIASRLAPPSRVEALTRLNFVQDNVLQDPPTALQLTARESNRIIIRLPSYLQPLRSEKPEQEI